jgi:hypothetical protein
MKTHKQLPELTISFSLSETYSGPYRPLSLRVTTKDFEGNEHSLDVCLPGVLHPSAAGLGEMTGVSKSYEDFDQLLANSPHTQDQSIHLYTRGSGDEEDPVHYWNALASSVFQAIWDEIKLLCDEKGLIMESVELR